MRFAGWLVTEPTAGGDFHPAPKTMIWLPPMVAGAVGPVKTRRGETTTSGR